MVSKLEDMIVAGRDAEYITAYYCGMYNSDDVNMVRRLLPDIKTLVKDLISSRINILEEEI